MDARGKEAQVFACDIDVEESPIVVYGSGDWIVALSEIDPVPSAKVWQLGRSERLDQAELPDWF